MTQQQQQQQQPRRSMRQSKKKRFHPYAEQSASAASPAAQKLKSTDDENHDDTTSTAATAIERPLSSQPPSIDSMQNTAVYSPCQRYRYYLKRVWDASKPLGAFLMLNPSTATEKVNDPTIRRCVGYMWSWGYGGMIVGNTFAFRTPSPAVLRSIDDPVGPENDEWVRRIVEEADIVVCAWGNHGTHLSRGDVVRELVLSSGKVPHMLAMTGQKQPMHPLYLAAKLRPIPMLTSTSTSPQETTAAASSSEVASSSTQQR